MAVTGVIRPPRLWTGFTAFMLIMPALEFGVFRRKVHDATFLEALARGAVRIPQALAFNAWIQAEYQPQRGIGFATGGPMQKALAFEGASSPSRSSLPSPCRRSSGPACTPGAWWRRWSCVRWSSSWAPRLSGRFTE